MERTWPGLVYDPTTGKTILIGGYGRDGTYWDDIKGWTGATASWQTYFAELSFGRFKHSLDFDFVRNEPILFGGIGGSPLGDTLILSEPCSAPIIASQPNSANTCEGSPLDLMVTASGKPPFHYQWRRGNPRMPIAGASGSVLHLAGIGADRGQYDCVVNSVSAERS